LGGGEITQNTMEILTLSPPQLIQIEPSVENEILVDEKKM